MFDDNNSAHTSIYLMLNMMRDDYMHDNNIILYLLYFVVWCSL